MLQFTIACLAHLVKMGAIDDTFGAWFVGMQVATVAFGFSILQTWIFFQRWDTEQLHLKILVTTVFALGFALVFLTSHGLYHYLVSSVGNPGALMEIVWSFKAEPWVSEALVVVTHCFYTGRIFYLNRNYAIFVLLALLTLGHCVLEFVASGVELSISGIAAGDLTERLASAGLGIDLTIDVIVMFSMFHFFHQNRTGFRATRSLLNRLAMYTFASGSLTVIANAVILSMFITKPQTQIYSGASFVQPHREISEPEVLRSQPFLLTDRLSVCELSLGGAECPRIPSSEVYRRPYRP